MAKALEGGAVVTGVVVAVVVDDDSFLRRDFNPSSELIRL